MSLINKSQSDAKRYTTSDDDLSYKELRFAGWYIRNKTKVTNVLIALLLVVTIIFVSFSTFRWIEYAAVGYQQDVTNSLAAASEFQDFSKIKDAFAPSSLRIGTTRTLAEGGTTDAITEVRNPNEDWIAIVTYRYGNTDAQTKIILPDQRNVLSLFGDNSNQRLALHIDDIRWRRVDAHVYPNTYAFITPRLYMPTENISVRQADQTLGTPYYVSFDIVNQTAYSYFEASFVALFYSGDTIVAARPILIDTFRSDDRESLQLNFIPGLTGVTDVDVVPDINVFDNSIYMEVGQ